MNGGTGAHRRWRRRAITVISLGVATVVGVAAPTLAHPVFSNDRPGFPNPNGGTGGGTQTPPYPAGSRPTLNMFTPFEQEGVIFNGAENTTVDVKVTIPLNWTSPTCGAASTSVGNRQVGTVVPAWTCAIETVSGHQVLHWTGPQVRPPKTFADSVQFFTFQVTVPSPAAQTSYGATGGPEGFYVEQAYADGTTSLWRTPNSTRPGEIANGIVRTVSNSTAPPPKRTGAPPPPDQEHGGPPPPPAQQQSGSGPPPSSAQQQGGGGPQPPSAQQQGGSGPPPPPAADPPPTGQLAAAGSPSVAAQGSSTPTSTEPPPGVDPAAEQLSQQRDDATGQGIRWQVLAGTVLAAVLVAGAAIAVVQRRRRRS